MRIATGNWRRTATTRGGHPRIVDPGIEGFDVQKLLDAAKRQITPPPGWTPSALNIEGFSKMSDEEAKELWKRDPVEFLARMPYHATAMLIGLCFQMRQAGKLHKLDPNLVRAFKSLER